MEKRYNKEIVAFGKRLKQLRERKGFTQLDMEIQTGMSRTEISRIENGKINIGFMTIVKLAASLDINIVSFFDDSL